MARASAGQLPRLLRQLELGREQAIRALELLIGRYPLAAAAPSPQLPGLPAEVPGGLPSALLERRPDVVAAERRVAVAFNRIGEAKAARLPAIALTTGLSAISSELFLLKDHDNPVWNLGANLLAPIYKGGASIRRSRFGPPSRNRRSPSMPRVGLRAFGEVENALAAEIAARQREQILAQALSDNQQALSMVQTQFKVGSTDLRSSSSVSLRDRHALRAHPGPGRTARPTSQSPSRARWQLRAAAGATAWIAAASTSHATCDVRRATCQRAHVLTCSRATWSRE